MNKFLTVFLLLLISKSSFSEDVDIQEVKTAGLPVLFIDTENGEEPTCDEILPPEGYWGRSITNASKVPGRVRIERGGIILYDSGDYMKKESGMTVKIRGNGSAYQAKKPFKIKLEKKADMLCRGNENKYADKNWILIKDETLKFKVGFKVNELLGLQWTPQYEYVNVVFNGEYRGMYMLLESVERNAKCRLNVDEGTGYIFELDAYWWNEDVYFASNLIEQLKYTFKYPDSDDVTQEQIDYIQGIVEIVENSLKDGTYPEYIDVESFASWIIGHELLGNYDGGGSNMYFTKYDNTDASKVLMGNMWDFDNIFNSTSWANVHNLHYFKSMFNNVNKEFVRTYKQKWLQFSENLFEKLIAYLDDYQLSEESAFFDNSIGLNNTRWHTHFTSVSSRVEEIKNWLSSRKEWLDANVPLLQDQEDLYNNTLVIQNDGKVEIENNELENGCNFISTACSDVLLKIKPGANMTLTYLMIDDEDVTADVNNDEYVLEHVLSGHTVEVRFDRTIVAMKAQYSTFCSTADLDFSAVNGLKAYVANGYNEENGIIELCEIEQVPAGTGLILSGSINESYQIPLATSVSVVTENLLIGVNEDYVLSPTEDTAVNYILANRDAGLGFYKLTDSGTLSAGKAYLQIPSSESHSQYFDFSFNEDNITLIKSITRKSNEDKEFYTLSGMKVMHLEKGVYIQKGKKIVNH